MFTLFVQNSIKREKHDTPSALQTDPSLISQVLGWIVTLSRGGTESAEQDLPQVAHWDNGTIILIK